MKILSHLKPTLHPSTLDIAWVAGIYEGEGSCKDCTVGARSFSLTISQSDVWILKKIRDLFGGSITGGRTRVHEWIICGPQARGFAMTIYKFLSPRRKEIIKKGLKVGNGFRLTWD